jgi:hypothetical protein
MEGYFVVEIAAVELVVLMGVCQMDFVDLQLTEAVEEAAEGAAEHLKRPSERRMGLTTRMLTGSAWRLHMDC